MKIHCLSILIPAFNEEKTIQQVLESLEQLVLPAGITKEVLIIDDGSTDRTVDVVRRYLAKGPNTSMTMHLQEGNLGKGAALRRAFSLASGELVVIQDADLEYDPSEFVGMLTPIIEGRADVVYGSRYLGERPHEKRFMFHSFGNLFLTAFSNLMSGLELTDMETCYKMMPTSFVKQLELKEQRFGIEPEVTAAIARRKDLRLVEVPISYKGRSFDEGKKIGMSDAVRACYCIVR